MAKTFFHYPNHGLLDGDITSLSGLTGDYIVADATTNSFSLTLAGVAQYFATFDFTLTLKSRFFGGSYKVTQVSGNIVKIDGAIGVTGTAPTNVDFSVYDSLVINPISKLAVLRHVENA